MTKGGQSRSSGAAYVSLQIARVAFDFLAAPSGDGTRDVGPGVIPSGGMGWPCRSVLGGNRIRAVSATEFSLLCSFGAPLAFSTLSPRTVCDANAPHDDSVGAPLVAATFLPCAVRDANASLLGCVGAQPRRGMAMAMALSAQRTAMVAARGGTRQSCQREGGGDGDRGGGREHASEMNIIE
jgi:hypothetical protein